MPLIPRQFHFIYGLKEQTQPFPLAYFVALESCRKVNRPDRIYFHYRNEPFGPYWDAIKPSLTLREVGEAPDWLSTFHYKEKLLRPYSYAHEADFIRIDVLNEMGGVYADIDTLFINPLPDELFTKSFVMGKECSVWMDRLKRMVPSLCNAMIMAEPNSPFGLKWREEMMGEFDGSWSRHSCELPRRLADAHPDWIHVEPPVSFFPFLWSKKDICDLLENDKAEKARGSYSIHLWNHLWWRCTRNESSWFHGGMLDHKYVAEGLTSYAKLAAPFLPAKEISQISTGWRGLMGRYWPV